MRIRITIRGAVQGVGFRPFIYRTALELGLTGWVSNSAQGVVVEAEGEEQRLRELLKLIERRHPTHASICHLEHVFLDSQGFTRFEIRNSNEDGRKAT